MFQKLFLPLMLLTLTACGEQTHTKSNPTPTTNNELVGCYSVHKDGTAQIKISHDDGYVMQMKEPNGATQAWDKPEALDELALDKAWEFFRVNTLDLQSADLSHVIARPDGMMALAKVNPTVANVNPLVDGGYVVHIVQGVNVIYQVPCDDVPLEIVKPSIHGVHGH
ncbi:hypothetical protein [Moraxella oblonga]|uniref:hypothetical protein n=1 Tax=Moraxella oblonga TaxID=200413 RepID=UPI000835BDD8|nr:hypothetical protein [Moraxella oblonga]